jgi:SAM-dependent MidA family methyltransferase
VTLIDYIIGVDELLGRDGHWLRTYRAQGPGTDPLVAPGTQDITADVLREQVTRAAHAAGFAIVDDRPQADWLEDLGLAELVAEARRAWDAGAARGDLEALAARSRVGEATALTDHAGLGAHRVFTMAKPPPTAST